MVVPIKPPEMMVGDFEDFIGVWHDHVPKFVCDKAIDYINLTLSENNSSFVMPPGASPGEQQSLHTEVMQGSKQFPNTNLGRKDQSILLNFHNQSLTNEFNQYLHACFLDYIDNFGNLRDCALMSTDLKLQKTTPGGGYHVWHCENSGYSHAQRVLVWAIYLNDVSEGESETEFLYQKRRVVPKRGTCVIWPAGFTHVHRGNPVYNEDKYILTGWYINVPVIK
jgi:hypothetical protein